MVRGRVRQSDVTCSAGSVQLASILACVGGMLDAYTYVCRGGVFANAQTGNIVLFGIAASQRRWTDALDHIPPILAFIAGVLVAEILRRPKVVLFLRWPVEAAMMLELSVLASVGMIPAGASNVLVSTLISFTMSVQLSMFRTLGDTAYNSTLATGNLRTFTQNAYAAVVNKDAAAWRHAIDFGQTIIAFFLGGVAGAWMSAQWSVRAAWAPAALLLGALVLLIGEQQSLQRPHRR
ncbi:YoaK family protein [Streptomyces sp. NPDC090080]|uniref:YoaK family protein n=1 Tax=Streptomyces sp. NPDC090080 TaxID=3365939 RepID=UPI0037F96D5A